MTPLLSLLFLGCTSTASDPLASLDARYAALLDDLGTAERDTARNVHNQEARARKTRADEARGSFFRDPKVQAAIEAARSRPTTDPVRAKAEGYWRNMIQARRWSDKQTEEVTRLVGRLEAAGAVSATWGSPDGALTVDLGQSWTDATRPLDGQRQELRDELADAYVQQHSHLVSEDLVELVRLRNQIAREEGFDTGWELALASQGLTPTDVDQVVAELTEVVAPYNQAVLARIQAASAATGLPMTWANLPALRRSAGLEQGRDVADGYFDTDKAEERVRTAYVDMGLQPENWQVYSGPSRYTRSGVYGFPIRPPEQIAIVMSNDRRWSLWQYEALAHEGGHATWWSALPPDQAASPALWEPPAPWSEGFAQFFERLVYEPAFTARYVPELPETERAPLAEWRASHVGAWITDSIVDTLVERRLYADPSNLEAVVRYAGETRARLTGLPSPPEVSGRAVWDPSLDSSILWNYPAYAQNYLFAYLTESWLYEAVVAQVGEPVGNPKVGPLLREKLIQQSPVTPFPDRLAALSPGDRAAALRKYLKIPPQAAQ